jgi:hypothetical protein
LKPPPHTSLPPHRGPHMSNFLCCLYIYIYIYIYIICTHTYKGVWCIYIYTHTHTRTYIKVYTFRVLTRTFS